MNLQTSAKIIETNYDRMGCKIGVVHIGYGAFHRAHQAVYFDRYMEISQDTQILQLEQQSYLILI